jgi:hypothetical protein
VLDDGRHRGQRVLRRLTRAFVRRTAQLAPLVRRCAPWPIAYACATRAVKPRSN